MLTKTFLNLNRTSSLFLIIVLSSILVFTSSLHAQVESPDDEFLFEEDLDSEEQRKEDQLERVLEIDKVKTDDIDFNAPNVEYLQESNVLQGTGGVVISHSGSQFQAEEGAFNLENKEADLTGNVVFTGAEGLLSCQKGSFNIETEVGACDDAEFLFEEGGYQISSSHLEKLSEYEYQFSNSKMSTCHCSDGSKPWSFHSNETEVSYDGYGHAHHTTLKLYDFPVFYTPYLFFPVKRERQSGLLRPTYGYSGRDGVEFEIPIFLVINDYSDINFIPFIESKTRAGSVVEYRHAISKLQNLSTRLVYSNESPRDGSLRGTNISGLNDPTFDEDRFGGVLEYSFRPEADSDIPFSANADIRYISDDLFLREMDEEDIGERTDRFVTSKVVVRGDLGDYVSADLTGEFNQATQIDDDEIFQRLPELNLNFFKSFRPFGFNPYGVKLVSKADVLYTAFQRDRGFDGNRLDLYPNLIIPFHYKNYFNSDISLGLRHTIYDLDNTEDLLSGNLLDDSQDRTVFDLEASVSTTVERVYRLDPGNWLSTLAGLGSENQKNELVRVKHTIEPYVEYKYVPDEDQDDLPLFDSLDRIREKSLVTYGVKTRLIGRSLPRHTGEKDIAELTPYVEELPLLDFDKPLSDFGVADAFKDEEAKVVKTKKGETRDLVTLGVKQSYDIIEDEEDNDPLRDAFSDVGVDLGFYPNRSFGFEFESNFDTEDREFSSWGVSNHFKDDRGDALRTRFTFIDDSVSQLDGNIEIALNERLKVGYYGKFDEMGSEFIENKVALRLLSACDCWKLDLGYSEQINPDNDQVTLTVTLKGIGDLGS